MSSWRSPRLAQRRPRTASRRRINAATDERLRASLDHDLLRADGLTERATAEQRAAHYRQVLEASDRVADVQATSAFLLDNLEALEARYAASTPNLEVHSIRQRYGHQTRAARERLHVRQREQAWTAERQEEAFFSSIKEVGVVADLDPDLGRTLPKPRRRDTQLI